MKKILILSIVFFSFLGYKNAGAFYSFANNHEKCLGQTATQPCFGIYDVGAFGLQRVIWYGIATSTFLEDSATSTLAGHFVNVYTSAYPSLRFRTIYNSNNISDPLRQNNLVIADVVRNEGQGSRISWVYDKTNQCRIKGELWDLQDCLDDGGIVLLTYKLTGFQTMTAGVGDFFSPMSLEYYNTDFAIFASTTSENADDEFSVYGLFSWFKTQVKSNVGGLLLYLGSGIYIFIVVIMLFAMVYYFISTVFRKFYKK